MKRPASLMIDGKPYFRRDLLKMRREQLEQCRAPDQPSLFALKDDRRPAPERTARRALRPAVALHAAR